MRRATVRVTVRVTVVAAGLVVALVAPLLAGIPALTPAGAAAPRLRVDVVAGGLDIPWDLAFAKDGTLFFTERPGRLWAVRNGSRRLLAAPRDVFAVGETGMMGLVRNKRFARNRILIVCQGYQRDGVRDIRVYRWRVNDTFTRARRIGDGPIVKGIRITESGRHGGCRLRIGPEGYLYVGTGDAAVGSLPQDRTSKNGKVLRVRRGNGAAAPGNPFGNRVWTYGHRNVQGLARQPGTKRMFSAEHGTSRDDEINRLRSGANFGWDPVPGYDESVPMTDTTKFPEAKRAVWSSGSPTIALSGITFLRGRKWGPWEGRLVGAALAGSHLRLFKLSDDGRRVESERVILTGWGRLRTPVVGPDRNLYVTTSNGGGTDRILRIRPV